MKYEPFSPLYPLTPVLNNYKNNISMHFNQVNDKRNDPLIRSFLMEVQARVQINNVSLMCLFDSGSETNLVGLQLLNKYLPGWVHLEDAQGPTVGIGAGGHEFKMVATKLFSFRITGSKNNFVSPMSITENMDEVLLGLPFLKAANVTMTFSDKAVNIYVDNELLTTNKQIKDSSTFFTLKYPKKLILKAKQSKSVVFSSPDLKIGLTYLIKSNVLSPSCVIPIVCDSQKMGRLCYCSEMIQESC